MSKKNSTIKTAKIVPKVYPIPQPKPGTKLPPAVSIAEPPTAAPIV